MAQPSHGYRPSFRWSMGIAWAAAVVFACWPGALVAHAAKLEVVSSKEARTVEFEACSSACPVGSVESESALVGQTTLLVQIPATESVEEKELSTRFVPDDGGTAGSCGPSPRVFLNGEVSSECRFEPVQVKTGELVPLRIAFSLPLGTSAVTANGNLVLELDGEPPVPVPLVGTVRQFKEVSVNPTSLTIDSDHPAAKVTLAGPELLEFLRSSLGPPTAVLRDQAGDTTTATVELPSAETVEESGELNSTEVPVTLTDSNPPAGKYTGKILLPALSAAPAVELELDSHLCFWVLVALALAGVLLGGLLTGLVTLAMRRSLLLKMLRQSMEAYKGVPDPEVIVSWRLEDLLDEPPSAASNERRLQGLPALTNSIETARSSKDLDEDAIRVLEMVARIQRWLRVEPAARRLALVGKERPTSDPKGLEWADSKVTGDTQALLELARRESPSPEKADELVRRLLSQAKWHHDLVAVWNASNRDKSLIAGLQALDKALGSAKTAEVRTEDEQDALNWQLRALVERLDSPGVPGMPAIKEPTKELTAATGITPVRWDASPNLFTGWATLDAQSYGQLSRRAATSARALSRPDYAMELHALSPADFGWTLVALGVASLAYGVTGYSDTWGSCQDLAKAFLAGMTGTVAVKWAALPIFQSIRLRASKAA